MRRVTVVTLVVIWAVLGLASGLDCFQRSSDPLCKDFLYPPAQLSQDLDSLCTSMPQMTACQLRRDFCPGATSSPVCQEFRLIADICAADIGMSGMKKCLSYNSLCSSGSVVSQCKDILPLKNFISSSDVISDAFALCQESANSGLDICQGCSRRKCDGSLKRISQICQKSTSENCEDFLDFCSGLHEDFSSDSLTSTVCGSAGLSSFVLDFVANSVDCIADPTNSACSSFEYPAKNVTANLDELCYWMPNMVGCSLRRKCVSGEISGMMCDEASLWGDICLFDTGMSTMEGCEDVVALCDDDNSKVPICATAKWFSSVVETSISTSNILKMCKSMPMSGCAKCSSDAKCDDPLSSLAQICLEMPGMAKCSEWNDMCEFLDTNAHPGNFTSICGIGSCITNPQEDSCSSFVYPAANISSNLDMLCMMMPNMVGCSIRTKCHNNLLSGKFCDDISIWGDICLFDSGMASMDGCPDMVSMCADGSKVPQCSSASEFSSVVQTAQSTDDVISMCKEMEMNGCSSCTSQSNCNDPFMSLGEVCIDMPSMSRCDSWKSMCDFLVDSDQLGGFTSFCGTDYVTNVKGRIIPLMRMYFHSGYVDYVLFQGWVPTNAWQYWLSFVAVIFMGIFSVFLRACRHHFDESLRQKKSKKGKTHDYKAIGDTEKSALLSPEIQYDTKLVSLKQHLTPTKSQLSENFYRALFSIFVVTVDYLLMLVAMTFNYGLFAAVVLGLSIGTFFWGHELLFTTVPASSCCD